MQNPFGRAKRIPGVSDNKGSRSNAKLFGFSSKGKKSKKVLDKLLK